jgi:hypothetical protein
MGVVKINVRRWGGSLRKIPGLEMYNDPRHSMAGVMLKETLLI